MRSPAPFPAVSWGQPRGDRLLPAAPRAVIFIAPMKPALFAVGSALLAGASFELAGRPLDPADYVVILLGVTLIVWTVEQYRRSSHSGP